MSGGGRRLPPIPVSTSNSYQPRPGDFPGNLTVRVNYTDSDGNNDFTPNVTVPILEAFASNTAPRFEESGQEVSTTRRVVQELLDSVPTTLVINVGAPVAAEDDDSNGHDVLTYTMSGGGRLFRIDRASGQISVPVGTVLDREATPSYRVTVTATDPSLKSDSITVTIELTDLDEGPFITSGPTEPTYIENGTGPVGTYRATDPEDDKARKQLRVVDHRRRR